jgi:hypothetical protein
MPRYIVTCRGSLITAKHGAIAPGGFVDMSAADAASLPLGTVALSLELGVVKPAPLPPVAPVAPVVPVTPILPAAVKPAPSLVARKFKDTKP